MKRAVLTLSLVIAGVAFATPALAYTSPGTPSGFVNDFADILAPQEQTILEAKLSAHERETGNEIVVVTVPSIAGDTIETYAVSLFEDWGIGKEELDNGALLLVAPNEREVRIEVGYGLEGLLTDAASSMIVRDDLIPAFRDGRFYSGINQATDRMIALVRGEETVSEAQPSARSLFASLDLFPLLVVFLFQIIPVIVYSKSWWLGGVIGFVAGLIVFSSLVSGFVLALIGLVLDYALSKKFGGTRPPGSSGGVWFGGMGGGSSFGGGRGFGGFGGGFSGGGGASGRW